MVLINSDKKKGRKRAWEQEREKQKGREGETSKIWFNMIDACSAYAYKQPHAHA